ncbi:CinA family protein [Pirellulaceae bacterium SH449]
MYFTLRSIYQKLLKNDARLVLAESCTSGMAAAELGQMPGISACFCGSMVVYQTESKISWLGVDEQHLNDPAIGPVSAWASSQLVIQLLKTTPHATISAAITGHLGPGSPPELDGVIFMAIASRQLSSPMMREARLTHPSPTGVEDFEARRARQIEATKLFLEWIDQILSDE